MYRRSFKYFWIIIVLLMTISTILGCVVDRPAICISTSAVTGDSAEAIRVMSQNIGEEYDAEVIDASDKYRSKNLDETLSLGIEIELHDASVLIMSSGLLTPTVCFYGSPDSENLQQLIETIFVQLEKMGFELKMENDRLVDSLPEFLQLKVWKAVGE